MRITFTSNLHGQSDIDLVCGTHQSKHGFYTSKRKFGLCAGLFTIRDENNIPVARVADGWMNGKVCVCNNGEWRHWAAYRDRLYAIGPLFMGSIVIYDMVGSVLGFMVPVALRRQARNFIPLIYPYRFEVLDGGGKRIGSMGLFRGCMQAITRCEYEADDLDIDHRVTGLHLIAVTLDFVHKLMTW